MKPSTRHLALFPLALSALFAPPSFAEDAPKTESVYELPKYVVTAQRILPQEESWRYARAGQFEILSNAGDAETQRLYRSIGEYIDVLNNIAPAMKPRAAVPIKLIICGQRGSFAKITGVTGVPVFARQNGGQIAFSINTSSDFAVPLNSGSNDADDTAAYVQNRVFRNYIDLRLNSFSPRMPPWFEHGMRSLFVGMKFNGNEVTFGEVRDGVWDTISPGGPPPDRQAAKSMRPVALSEESLDTLAADTEPPPPETEPADTNADIDAPPPDNTQALLRVRTTARIPIMRMDDFFRFNPAGPRDEQSKKINAASWARQCMVFVHYWLYRRTSTPKDKAAFEKLLLCAAQGPVDEAFFKQCFGFGYRNMELDLARYQGDLDYNYTLFKFREDTRPPKLELRDATPAEIGRIKGESMAIFGKTEEGYHEMLAPYIRKQGDANLHAALGLFENEHGDLKKARAFLEIAAKEKTARADACRALSQLRRKEIMTGKSMDYRLTPEELQSVIEPLLAARALPPPSVETYLLLADTLQFSQQPPPRELASIVLEGVNRHPSHPGLTLLAANVMMRGEFYDAAKPLVQRALKQSGQNDTTLAWLREASERLAALPPAAAPAPAK